MVAAVPVGLDSGGTGMVGMELISGGYGSAVTPALYDGLIDPPELMVTVPWTCVVPPPVVFILALEFNIKLPLQKKPAPVTFMVALLFKRQPGFAVGLRATNPYPPYIGPPLPVVAYEVASTQLLTVLMPTIGPKVVVVVVWMTTST